MKKCTLALLFLLAPVLALAGVVSQGSAKASAERFINKVAPARTPHLQLVFETPRMTKAVSTDPAYYIFADEGGGYVIASGDDCVPPILGYSTTGSLRAEEMPDNMKAWLDMWSDIVEGCRASGAAPWQEPARTKAGSAKLLETASWGQHSPFNDKCYVLDGQHALTGCTATATAILMRYHQWPDKGVGTLPAYTFNRTDGDEAEYTQEAVPLGHAYDWDNMPLNGMSNWNSAQKDAVATLLRDCAVMLQSDFGLNSTSAYIGDVPTTLVQYMKYDASIDIDRLNYYTEPLAWVRRIEDNIDNNGPVAYAGYTDKSGHAFIVDGYDEQDFLHVNWGWNGTDNGYFAAPDGFPDYTKDHVAVLGAKKDAGGESTAYIELDNLKSSATSYAPGTTFTVTAMFFNMGTGYFNGSVAIAKYNRNGEFIEQVSDPLYFTNLKPNYGQRSQPFSCKLSAQIKAGDYITLVYRASGDSGWTPARFDHNVTSGRIYVGDSVLLDQNVRLQYDVNAGQLTVFFDCDCSRELHSAGGSAVTTGVSNQSSKMIIDATKLKVDTYILHMQRGEQVKDITLHLGLK